MRYLTNIKSIFILLTFLSLGLISSHANARSSFHVDLSFIAGDIYPAYPYPPCPSYYYPYDDCYAEIRPYRCAKRYTRYSRYKRYSRHYRCSRPYGRSYRRVAYSSPYYYEVSRYDTYVAPPCGYYYYDDCGCW